MIQENFQLKANGVVSSMYQYSDNGKLRILLTNETNHLKASIYSQSV